ncbi:MAG TPA: nucleoside triphosphate pyrophosphohydrolase [Armatimonadetes bacterium]|nr:nucleoside triphosphate pyrophosphohydrolase [Armatimonadota bacterium]
MGGAGEELERLRDIIALLRGPEGCPWDREQTHESLRDSLLEEAYEVVEAIDEGDDERLREELGDIFIEAVFHARLAEERGAFSLEEVVRGANEKLISRHPHVFGEERVKSAQEVLERWQERKQRERMEKGEDSSALAGVPKSLPGLMRAEKLQKRAELAGFVWPAPSMAWEKAEEEWAELKEALESGEREEIERELGHLLFALVNAARMMGISAERALRRANAEFEGRFRRMEKLLAEEGLKLGALSIEEKMAVWEKVKRGEG